jgi:hypothetical protein
LKEITKALLLSCLPIVVGALISVGALYYWRLGRDLRNLGVTTKATVVAKHRYGRKIVFALRFTDLTGYLRTVEISVPTTRGSSFSEGNVVNITYVPARPEKAAWGLKWGAYIEGWLALIFAAFGIGMVVFGLYQVLGLLMHKLKPGDI